VMRGAAGLHGNRAYRQLLGPSLKCLALEDTTFHNSAVKVQHARCDHILRQVQTNSSKLIHDFPFRYRLTTAISILALDAARLQRRGGTGKSLPVEKLCFERAANASGPLERPQSCAHGGVPATHHLSPTSRSGARRVTRDPTLSTAQQLRRFRRPSEIEFFN